MHGTDPIMVGGFLADDRERIRFLSFRGTVQLVKQGGWPGRPPLGYRKGLKAGILDVCTDEARLISRAACLMIERTDEEISAVLRAEGLRTNRGTDPTPYMIRNIRKNPIIVGIVRVSLKIPQTSGRRLIVVRNERYRIIPDSFFSAAIKAAALRAEATADHVPAPPANGLRDEGTNNSSE